MTIAVSDEHEALGSTVRRWLDAHCPPEAARALLDAAVEELQPVWAAFADQGWLGIHVPERWGGQGNGLYELAVVLEQTGRSMLPGPLLPTVLTTAILSEIAEAPSGGHLALAGLIPGLVDGSTTAAVAMGCGSLLGRIRGADGTLEISGQLRPVLGAQVATVALVPVCVEGGEEGPDSRDTGPSELGSGEPVQTGELRWCLIDVADGSGALAVQPLESLDPTRRVGVLTAESVTVAADRMLPPLDRARVAELAVVLGAAELTGLAGWCLDTASEYAKVRRQFGRPIGQFQAVKHRLADMVVRTEQIAAVSWDAAMAADAGAYCVEADEGDRGGSSTAGSISGGPDQSSNGRDRGRPVTRADECSLACASAGALVLDGAVDMAKACIQLLGGIGFTWEHDAHLYLKRALATRQILGGPGGGDTYHHAVFDLARRGIRRSLASELPEEAEPVRAEIRPLVAKIATLDPEDRRPALVQAGLVNPHWPRPYGRDASAIEQLVIDDELAGRGIVRPNLGVGAWALPVLIAFGSEEQKARWIMPTLLGEIIWCQLFSEPGAGSDLASLTTCAERVRGGWSLTGQKVWTSMAEQSQWGICLARTDTSVPKHQGITYFIIDMKTGGIDIRPLREITGDAMFNEVFMDDVFVPDDAVIGSPGDGWSIARATLASERVSMSSGATFGVGIESLLRLVERHGRATPDTGRRLGSLLVEAQSIRLLSHRASLRTLAGTDAAATTSVRKLLGVEHEQRVQEEGLQLLGPEGVVLEGGGRRWAHGFLVTRCLTIAGGTSEIQRNVIAERILGQPRDPEP
ncbi:MAG: acyl-CoA dehydrogenase [Acidimicrobiales bacterium]